jgi:hypothetical protein
MMLKLRDLLAGGLLAAFLVACSAAAPTSPGDGSAAQTAGPIVDAAQTGVPGLDATAASGASAAATAAPTALPAAQATAGAATGRTADEMTAMVGQPMTVSGPVTQIADGMLFQLDDPTHGAVTVLVPSGSFSVAQGQSVEVSGTVAQFDPASLEQQLGIQLDESLVASLGSATVIVADTVNPAS